ncbi:MAG: gamma-glutamyltransferase, partial [Halioglobus sp.]|nr:gamma-glutamyltransferase [Halioglobus sp.]
MRHALSVFALALTITGAAHAQSEHAFGVPTDELSDPSATIVAAPGSRAQGWQGQGRSEVLARHGMVATSDPLAAQAGLEILQAGGNAIDAAVAAGAVLDVTSPNDTGIGGDLFALVWNAADGRLYALNSGGWSPAGWTLEYFTKDLGLDSMARTGVNAVTVPGAVSGYDALLSRFGTMGFDKTFERAASIAEEGWGQAERRHADIESVRDKIRKDADSAATFLVNGEVPPLYSIVRNPDLASALRLIQREGRDA